MGGDLNVCSVIDFEMFLLVAGFQVCHSLGGGTILKLYVSLAFQCHEWWMDVW